MSFNADNPTPANSSVTDQFFRDGFTYAAFGMALVGLDGKMLRVNHSICRFLGYSEEEFAKLAFQEITYAGDLDADILHQQRLLQGEIETYQSEKRYIHKEGHLVWGLLGVSLVRDEQGHPLFFVSQIQDIKVRKVAQEALRISEERLAHVIRGTGVGLWDWHIPSGQFVLNERWAEMLGYTLAELGPITLHTWDPFIDADDLRRTGEALEKHFAGLSEYYECEVRLRHKEGHWVWVLDRGKVVEWDADGNPVRMTGTHMDISERKAVEAERESMIVQLQTALDEVKKLQGILPICSYCKQVRNDENYWQTVETYISEHTGAELSHGICPDCYEIYVREPLALRKSEIRSKREITE